jgi:DNA-directed RNA polymerase subunit N (RpoN/RPB10)
MTILKLNQPGRQVDFAGLQQGLIDYANRVEQLRSPDEVLDELHAITTRYCRCRFLRQHGSP